MRFSTALSCAFTALLAVPTMAAPFAITPGDANHVILTDDNTINTTQSIQADAVSAAASRPPVNMFAATDSDFIELSFINKMASSNVKAYVTGRDSNNALVMLHPDGTWFYPPATTATTPQPITENVAIPLGAQGSTVKISLPGYISAGRIWFADGNLQFFTVNAGGQVALVEPSAVNPSDPSSAVNWGFIELTYLESAIYTNLSYVDFVGLPLGQKLTACDGTVLQAQGVHTQAVEDICADLEEQTCIDGYPWADLCAIDAKSNALRVLAPYDYISLYPNAFSDYWTSYVNDVWNYYSTTPLTIDTQVSAGLVKCTTNGDYLTCAGDNRPYAKPSAPLPSKPPITMSTVQSSLVYALPSTAAPSSSMAETSNPCLMFQATIPRVAELRIGIVSLFTIMRLMVKGMLLRMMMLRLRVGMIRLVCCLWLSLRCWRLRLAVFEFFLSIDRCWRR
jgi:hypothetical protein